MKKYDSYKDSGVKWLGGIPEGWEFIKMKFLFKDVSVKNRPDLELLSVTQNMGVVPRDLVESRMVMPTGNLESFKVISKGDFAISLRSFEGGLEYSNYEGIISPAYTVLKSQKEIAKPYYRYLFKSKSFIGELQLSIVGIREGKNISYEELKYSYIQIPPLSEQQTIAEFLDDKTTKIDQLIAIKEKEINLLKERRQILIQKAVTKGLDPTVKMKDSGVDWIGEIPEHWEVRKLKYVFDFIRTGTTPPTGNQNYFDGEINWFNPKDLNEGILVEAEKKISNFAISQKEIKMFPGDSILIVGIGATSGKTAYLVNNATFNQQITGFHSITENNKFYYYFMKCATTLMLNLANYTTLPILNNEFFKSFLTIVPPINEQIQIVTYIEEKDEKISKAILLKQQEMEKLNEYKTVLIDNAVTGKMKVV